MPKGSPGVPRTVEGRLAAFIDKNGPLAPGLPGRCWLWLSTMNDWGYGVLFVKGRKWMAHRFMYEREIGPIPDGLTLDHLCRRRDCVNPRHVEPVTQAENNLRSPIQPTTINKNKTHCIHGHPLSGRNLIIRANNGGRDCRECTYKRVREYKARLRARDLVLFQTGDSG